MEKQTKNHEIGIGVLWKVLRARFIFLIIALVLGGLLGFGYSRFLVTPQYSSSAEFMGINTASNGINSSYLQGTEMLAANYAKYASGNVFLSKVVEQYNAENGTALTAAAIKGKVTATPYGEDSTFTVKISSSSAEEAYKLLSIYEKLLPPELSRLDEIAMGEGYTGDGSKDSDFVYVILSNRGYQATAPDSPNVKLNVLLGAFLAVIVAYIVFLLISILDKTVYHEEAIKEHFDVPVIGHVPSWERPGDNAKSLHDNKRTMKRDLRSGRPIAHDTKGRLLDSTAPFSISEAFKTLRTNLTYSAACDGKSPVFGIVSDFSGAGKSLVASNVAIGFAQLDKKVLLIDGDMRCPVQQKTFSLPRGGKGLSEALAGIAGDPFTECITKTAFDGLDLMHCGRIPPNPNELLASVQMKNLVEQAREKYDYIIIDLPPVCATSDAGVLAPLLTGYILVARAGYSNLTALQDSVDILTAVHANILGFVINDVDVRSGGRYYGGRGRYSRYYYYSGARYSEEQTESKSK